MCDCGRPSCVFDTSLTQPVQPTHGMSMLTLSVLTKTYSACYVLSSFDGITAWHIVRLKIVVYVFYLATICAWCCSEGRILRVTMY